VDELRGLAVSTRDLGIFSEPWISVLELNLALEKAFPKK
jgi:K+-transporting ATPase c subunit